MTYAYPFSAIIPTEPPIQADSIVTIVDAICKHYSVSMADLESPTRKRPIVTARQWCMYFMKKDGRWTLQRIGDEFNRDHTSVIHAFNLIEGLIGCDMSFRETYRVLNPLISKQ